MRGLHESLKRLQFLRIGLGALGHKSVNMSMTAALIVLIRLKQAKNGPIHGNIFQNPLHCALLTMMNDQKVKTGDSLIS